MTPRKRSVRQETYRVRRILQHPISQLSLRQLHPEVLAGFRDERLEAVGPQAVRHDLNLLSHVFNHARTEWGVRLSANPVALVSKPSLPRGRNRRLEPDEERRLMSGCSQPSRTKLAPVIALALETGMRRSELLGGRWGHIDLERRTWLLPQTKNGHSRTVPLSPRAVGTRPVEAALRCAVTREMVCPLICESMRAHDDGNG